jgi:hypothetical protein
MQKIVIKLSKIWFWDPGSGKNLFWIPDPGVKKPPDPGSGSATLLSVKSDNSKVHKTSYDSEVCMVQPLFLCPTHLSFL